MVFTDTRVDRLLDLVYDAAADQEQWPSVLAGIAELTCSSGGALLCRRTDSSRLYVSSNGSSSPAFNAMYVERRLQTPWAALTDSQPAGRVVFSGEISEPPSIRQTSIFGEIVGPRGVRHDAMIGLVAEDGFSAASNLFRSAQQGPFGEDERRLLERLAPHLSRAVRLAFRIEACRALQGGEHQALDLLSIGVILLDGRGCITGANAAARAFSTKDGLLNLCAERVAARSPAHSQRLGELIGKALNGAPAALMSLPRPDDGGLVTLLVSPALRQTPGRFAGVDMRAAAVVIFIIDPASRAGLPASWIIDAYGLTRAEARAALAVAAGHTVPEAAVRLGASPSTVKTHLRRAFAKTGVTRQAELARLVTLLGVLKPDVTSL